MTGVPLKQLSSAMDKYTQKEEDCPNRFLQLAKVKSNILILLQEVASPKVNLLENNQSL